MNRPSSVRPSWRRLLAFSLLFLALSAGVPYGILHELGGQWPSLDGRLLQPGFLLACAGLLAVYFGADGLRLWFLTRALGYRVDPRQMAPLVFLNILVSNLTPMATGGGFAQIWYLRRLGMPVGAATAAATLRTLLASVGIFVPSLLMLWWWPALAGRVLTPGWAYVLGGLAALYLAGFALVFWRLRWVLGALRHALQALERWRWISPVRQRRWYFALRRETVRFAVAMRLLANRRGPNFWWAIVATLVFLLALFSVPALLLWGLGYAVPLFQTLGLSTLITFVMYFAPTPGGAGIAEGLFSLLFAGYVSRADLFVLVLGWRFLTIHLAMLVGAPILWLSLWRGHDRDT